MLTEAQLKEVDDVLGEFCRREPPAHVRPELEYAVRIDGDPATLVELRPAFRAEVGRTESPVARFRFTKSSGTWQLFWRDRNSRWHRYDQLPPTKRLAPLLDEVRRDPAHIFWG